MKKSYTNSSTNTLKKSQRGLSVEDKALTYHASGRPGKIEVVPTKRTKTQRDLSLAYSPGVAIPCKEISNHPEDVYKYTAKGNLVAVVTNGTAVLGLGNIGPEASKPVMEGKGVLFKIFADIDVFDIEIDEKNPDKFVEIVKSLTPTFGGINLEDIKAPECFLIEERLKQECQIPVMHDDQHGTAIISGAALLNALELQKKKINKIKIVVSGAGAAASSCCKMYVALGANPKNFYVFDRSGLVYEGREKLPVALKGFYASAKEKHLTLETALKDADVFIGLSSGNILKKEFLKTMAPRPIVFAMANPDPEIGWEDASSVRKDLIMATGRSDYPNQVNNVLGFPYIFRGALDVRATQINEPMKMAAVKAIADLAKKPVPDMVALAYDDNTLSFGPNYIIPKPLDPRLLSTVAPAVAKAAMESGVALQRIKNWDEYTDELNRRLGYYNQFINVISNKARKSPKRIVFGEGEQISIIKAARTVLDEGIGFPMLLGSPQVVESIARENRISLQDIPIIDPTLDALKEKRSLFADLLFKERQRKGLSRYEAEMLMRRRTYFGCMMVRHKEADGFISGLQASYSKTLKPALEIIGISEKAKLIAGVQVISAGKRTLFLADTTVNINPTAEELAEITLMVAKGAQAYGVEPKVAMLSYSSFGSSRTEEAQKVRQACEIVKSLNPNLKIDGEMHADMAINAEKLKKNYPFSSLVGEDVNCLIFPNLSASNISYNLLTELSEYENIGPIIMGLKEPVHVLQVGASVRSIVNMATVCAVESQRKNRSEKITIAQLKNTYYWKQFCVKRH